MRCAVAGCHTDYQSKNFTNDLMFFLFPNDENLSKGWLNACKREDKFNVKNARICSKHFDKDCYERNLKFELLGYSARNRRLKPDALPTLNLPNKCNKSLPKNREDRLNKRNRTKFVNSILDASECSSEEQGGGNANLKNSKSNNGVGDPNIVDDEQKDIGSRMFFRIRNLNKTLQDRDLSKKKENVKNC